MLSISREEFRQIYAGLSVLDSEELFYSKPVNDVDLLTNYLPSKLWRLNNVYTIIDKYGEQIRFRMNKAQHKVYAASLRHPRIIILKSRQQGISTLWLIAFFDDAVTRTNFNIGLMAQGTDEATTLLERTKLLWDTLDNQVKSVLNISVKKDNTKEFSFTNGANIFIRTSFRSATLQRLHISEMGKIANKHPEKAKETKRGTLQALAQGNIGVVESTAEGDNMFKSMWDNAVAYSEHLTPKDFYPVFLSWLDDPDCSVDVDQIINDKHQDYFTKLEAELNIKLTRQQKNFWITQYRELGDGIFQEYPSTPIEAFMATKDGAYYAHLYMVWVKGYNREVPAGKLYDKNLDVQLAVDLGMDDTMVLGAFQTYMNQFRFIGEYADNGKDIEFYCDWIKKQHWYDNLVHVILPHDAEVTDLTSGKTRLEVFEEHLPDVLFTVLPKSDRMEGIEQVRQMVKILWIDQACEYIKSCLLNYTKEWDEKRERWRDTPLHDEYSNGADMLRYAAIGGNRNSKPRQTQRSTSEQLHSRRMRGDTDV